jgi:hypothetical protein
MESIKNVELRSRMSIRREFEPHQIQVEGTIRHRLHKFTAVVSGSEQQRVRRDFPLLSLADPQLSEPRRVFGGPRLRLEEAGSMSVPGDGHVSISAHAMSLPFVDAIVGQTLFDHFGDYRFDRILAAY